MGKLYAKTAFYLILVTLWWMLTSQLLSTRSNEAFFAGVLLALSLIPATVLFWRKV